MAEELSAVAQILAGAPVEDPPEGEDKKPEDLETDLDSGADVPTDKGTVSVDSPEGADSDGSSDTDSEGDETGDEGAEDLEPLTVSQIAEEMGIEPAEVYERLQVSIGEDSMSFGEFKDRAKDLLKSDKLLADATTAHDETTVEVDSLRRGISVAVRQLGRLPTDAEVQQGNEEYQTYLRGEAAAVLTVIPAWKDPPQAAKEHGDIQKLMAGYHFRASEVANVTDHRQLRLLNDYAKLKARIDGVPATEIKKGVRQHQGKKAPRKAAKQTTAETIKADHSSGKLTRNDAVTALILGGISNEREQS